MQQVMMDIYKVALIGAWPVAIGGFLASGATFFIARQLGQDREQLRQLRVALERDPSPGQIGQGLRMWPDCARFPANLQVSEMIRRANQDENKKAERVEKTMGWVRTIAFIATLGVALIVAGMIWKPA